MKRVVTTVVVLVVIGIGACRLCWPEEYAVNAPLSNALFGWGRGTPDETERTRLRAPEGYEVSLFAGDVPQARWLHFTPRGDLLVSQPRLGQVSLLERDGDRDGRSDGARVLISQLNRPHGLELRDGWLWVGETDAVGRIRFDAQARAVEGEFERIVTGLPGGGNHWSRTVRFGPDDRLYVSVGSSCNVCIEDDPRRAALLRFGPDGSGGEVFASGLRNTVGFDWQPGTGHLYGTDNGRDLLGDDFPPCELNRIEEGGFYGWPYANGDRVPDPDFGQGPEAAERIARSIPPAHGFRAHNAPLGITFVRGEAGTPAGADYRGAALVALHGSWNRTRKDGYKVVSLHWTGDGSIVERDFLVGFEEDGDVIGRPVDVAEGPDGAFYVSDDYSGSVWRVSRAESAVRRAPGAGSSAPSRPATHTDPLASIGSAELETAAREGPRLFEHHDCATCHVPGRTATGVVPVPLRDLDARYTLDSLEAFLLTPTPPMPVPDLTPPERRTLATYLLQTGTLLKD